MMKRFREWLKTLKVDKIKWYPSPEFLAQAAHVLLGLVAVTWPYALWQTWKAALVGSLVVLGYMILKEFTFDIWVEGDTVDVGWKDLIYLCFGLFFGWVSLVAAGVL